MKILIEGNPIGKKRHRCRCVHGHGQAYDEQSKNEMPVIKSLMHSQIGNSAIPFDSDVSLSVSFTFYLPINKSDTIAQRNGKLWGFIHPNVKPDFDNLIKFYCDCANGVLWRDDCMVVEASSKKKYAKFPRVEMEINEIPVSENSLAIDLLSLMEPKQFIDLTYEIRKIYEKMRDAEYEIFRAHEEMVEQPVLAEAAMLLSDFVKEYFTLFKKMEKIRKESGYDNDTNSIEGLQRDG